MSVGIKLGIGRALSLKAERRYQDKVRAEEQAARKAELEEARAFEREMFNAQLLENRRLKALETIGTRLDKEKEVKAKISKAVGIGLTETGATTLLRTGQLDLLLDKYDQNQKRDPQFMRDLNNVIENQLADADDETKAAILLKGVETSRDVSDPRESMSAIADAILDATTPEQLEELETKLREAGSTYTPLPAFDIDLSTLAGADLSETAAMDKEIARGLSTYFKGSFVRDSVTGDLIVNQDSADSPVVQGILNEAQRKARELSFGPTREFTPTSAANYVVTQLESAIRGTQGRVKPADILTNFDTILTDPTSFSQTFVPPVVDVPETSRPEEDVEALGDSGFNFDVDRF